MEPAEFLTFPVISTETSSPKTASTTTFLSPDYAGSPFGWRVAGSRGFRLEADFLLAPVREVDPAWAVVSCFEACGRVIRERIRTSVSRLRRTPPWHGERPVSRVLRLIDFPSACDADRDTPSDALNSRTVKPC